MFCYIQAGRPNAPAVEWYAINFINKDNSSSTAGGFNWIHYDYSMLIEKLQLNETVMHPVQIFMFVLIVYRWNDRQFS